MPRYSANNQKKKKDYHDVAISPRRRRELEVEMRLITEFL